jgi:hypothetical protein
LLKRCAEIRVLNRSALNHIDFFAEDPLQAILELEVPVKESIIPCEFDEHVDVA